ncbi:hypothetical protein D3C83_98320 [compost metagenome]
MERAGLRRHATWLAAREQEVPHLNAALGADDPQQIVLLEHDRAADFSDDLVLELEDCGCPFVGALLAEMSNAQRGDRIEKGSTGCGAGDEA